MIKRFLLALGLITSQSMIAMQPTAGIESSQPENLSQTPLSSKQESSSQSKANAWRYANYAPLLAAASCFTAGFFWDYTLNGIVNTIQYIEKEEARKPALLKGLMGALFCGIYDQFGMRKRFANEAVVKKNPIKTMILTLAYGVAAFLIGKNMGRAFSSYDIGGSL